MLKYKRLYKEVKEKQLHTEKPYPEQIKGRDIHRRVLHPTLIDEEVRETAQTKVGN